VTVIGAYLTTDGRGPATGFLAGRLAPRRRTPPSGCPATRPWRYQAMVAGTVAVVGGSRSGVYVPWLKTPNRKTGLVAKNPPSE
jgi:hypothetical protein